MPLVELRIVVTCSTTTAVLRHNVCIHERKKSPLSPTFEVALPLQHHFSKVHARTTLISLSDEHRSRVVVDRLFHIFRPRSEERAHTSELGGVEEAAHG